MNCLRRPLDWFDWGFMNQDHVQLQSIHVPNPDNIRVAIVLGCKIVRVMAPRHCLHSKQLVWVCFWPFGLWHLQCDSFLHHLVTRWWRFVKAIRAALFEFFFRVDVDLIFLWRDTLLMLEWNNLFPRNVIEQPDGFIACTSNQELSTWREEGISKSKSIAIGFMLGYKALGWGVNEESAF